MPAGGLRMAVRAVHVHAVAEINVRMASAQQVGQEGGDEREEQSHAEADQVNKGEVHRFPG